MHDPNADDVDSEDVHDTIVSRGLQAYHGQELITQTARRLNVMTSLTRVLTLAGKSDGGVLSDVDHDMDVDVEQEKALKEKLLAMDDVEDDVVAVIAGGGDKNKSNVTDCWTSVDV